MRQVFELLVDAAIWLWGFLFGSVLSGLVWDEINHQITHRGIMQKICHLFIALAAKQYESKEARTEYIQTALATVEKELVDRRHLKALSVSISLIWNSRTRRFIIFVFYFVTLTSVATPYLFHAGDWKFAFLALLLCLFHVLVLFDMCVYFSKSVRLLLKRLPKKTRWLQGLILYSLLTPFGGLWLLTEYSNYRGSLKELNIIFLTIALLLLVFIQIIQSSNSIDQETPL